MRNNKINNLSNRLRLFAVFALFAAISAIGISGSLRPAFAQQNSEDRAIRQVQRAVRDQIIRREGGRGQVVRFNNDAQIESSSNSQVLVRGTGSFSNNSNARNSNARNNDARNNYGRSRDFSYEATVNNRNRNGTVSGIRYDWQGNWSNDRRGNNRDDYRVQNIYCASDDGRRHNCPINTNGGNVRLVTQRSGSNCVQGQTWGVNNGGIWVDRGCRADFEVSGGRGDGINDRGYDGRDNNANYGNAVRPNGRVIYSGPITNRRSERVLDVTEQGMQDGANIQQWSYADQPNQNWDVLDLGNNEVAIISRHSGRVLTVQGGRDNNGANIIQRGWNNTRQQRWRLEQTGGDYYRIVSVDNGKCLDVTEQGKENGANVQLWNYANQANQQWRFKR